MSLFEQTIVKFQPAKGKTIAITGCTSGTGLVAAKVCLEKGATVIMLNRPSAKHDAAERFLRNAVQGCDLYYIQCDLTSFASVQQASDEVAYQFRRKGIDVLVNNAGIMAFDDRATEDGYCIQMQTNHLSHFLLTKNLMPLLEIAAARSGEPSVVVNHSSIARKGNLLQRKYFEKKGGDLGGNWPFGRWMRYHQTKLANAVFTLAMTDRLEAAGNSNVKCVCVAPGVAATDLQSNLANSAGMGFIPTFHPQSAEDGTLPLLAAILGWNQADGPVILGGEFWEPICMGGLWGYPGRAELTAECTDEESRILLWELSEQACGDFKF